jgi:hypothetical protein
MRAAATLKAAVERAFHAQEIEVKRAVFARLDPAAAASAVLGYAKLESTVRYLGIRVDDAPMLSSRRNWTARRLPVLR